MSSPTIKSFAFREKESGEHHYRFTNIVATVPHSDRRSSRKLTFKVEIPRYSSKGDFDTEYIYVQYLNEFWLEWDAELKMTSVGMGCGIKNDVGRNGMRN